MATNNWSAGVWGDYQWSVRLEMGGGVLAKLFPDGTLNFAHKNVIRN
jgi:hypothetical protein